MRESLKPIEPGCLVLVVAGERVGAEGTMARWSSPDEYPAQSCAGCGRRRAPVIDWSNGTRAAICRCALIRIDPDDEQREAWEREERLRRLGRHPAFERFAESSPGAAALAHRIRELGR